jgi:hypothetical protein
MRVKCLTDDAAALACADGDVSHEVERAVRAAGAELVCKVGRVWLDLRSRQWTAGSAMNTRR